MEQVAASGQWLRPRLAAAVTLMAAVAAYWVLIGLIPERAARAASILAIAAGFWATEALPLFATALVVIALEILLLADVGGLAGPLSSVLEWFGLGGPPLAAAAPIDAAQFLAPFSQDIVILFMAGFLLSSAMTTHGVDRVLAARVLRPVAASGQSLVYGLLGLSALLSMWMSNTATAAMMLSLINPVVAARPPGDRFAQALILAVAFGANIGGVGTPIGSPPNAIAYGALNAAGYPVTFLSWMLVAVPLAVLLLLVAGLLLDRWWRDSGQPDAPIEIPEASAQLSRHGRATLVVLAVAVACWVTSGAHGVRPGTIGLLAVAALSAVGALDRRGVNAIDWSVLILMWGGLSLSIAMETSGLTAVMAGADVARFASGPWLAAIATVTLAAGMSTVMSNTAAAALLVPLALALSLPSQEQVAMLAALGCSLAMALPVSTPPNAVAYATGRVELAAMRRVGGRLSIAAMVIVLVGYQLVLPLIF